MRKITYFIRNMGHAFRTKRGKNDILPTLNQYLSFKHT